MYVKFLLPRPLKKSKLNFWIIFPKFKSLVQHFFLVHTFFLDCCQLSSPFFMTHNLETYCCTFSFCGCECILKGTKQSYRDAEAWGIKWEVERKNRNFSICFEYSGECFAAQTLRFVFFLRDQKLKRFWQNALLWSFGEKCVFIHSMKYCIKWPRSENCSLFD